jgi:hypothetical protein
MMFRQEGGVVKRLSRDAGKIRDLSAPYQQQLNSYALAAAAAGVSLLALAQKSEARIIYTATHRVIADGDSYSLDFTGNGTTDLTLGNKYRTSCGTEGTCWRFQSLIAHLAGSNQAVRNVFGAVAMKPGMPIGSKASFAGGPATMAILDGFSMTSTPIGSWVNVKNRYLGVKFKIKGKIHYGWARLSVQVQFPLTITATLTGYAYETIPDKGIIAGKTKGPESSVEHPATLGRLALGKK